jgi:hypothetical protein
LATVSTAAVTGILPTIASSGGNVTADGRANVLARGVCWATTADPTTASACTSDGTGLGAFTSSLTSLSPATSYHVRAYATNAAGTAYGADVQFTTLALLPTVTTFPIAGITSSSATSGGNVTADGGAAVTARGACWATTPLPTTANTCTDDGSGTGAFASSLTGLAPATSYHVRAYATNSAGTAYGADVQFETLAVVPTVTTSPTTGILSTSAASGGTVTADGGAAVTAKGACWSTAPSPTTANTCTNDGSGTGVFTSSLTGLSPATSYHVRAYATNAAGTAYGADVQFTTLAVLPTVTTSPIAGITSSSATSGGNVTADGGAAVTARGACWATTPLPTTANTCTDDGSGTGAFASSLTGLSPATSYHVRAYATNSAGTAYGADVQFETLERSAKSKGSSGCQTGTGNGMGLLILGLWCWRWRAAHRRRATVTPTGDE